MNLHEEFYTKAGHTTRVEDSFLTRRQWLTQTGTGFGALALSCMLAEDGFGQGNASGSVLAAKTPPKTPKAKRVLNIFLRGAAPHMDLWDPRPELNRSGGKAQGNRKLLASPFNFPKYGKSGLQFSEIWPNLGRHADDVAIVRSTYTDAPAHGPATYMQNTGEMQEIRPAVGSWVLYGLGTENQNLPGFITMSPGGGMDGRNYTNSFLPGAFQGTFVNANNTKIEDIIKREVAGYGYGTRREDQTQVIRSIELFGEVHTLDGPVLHEQCRLDCVEAWRSHATLARQAGDRFHHIVDMIDQMLADDGHEIFQVPYTTRIWAAQIRNPAI